MDKIEQYDIQSARMAAEAQAEAILPDPELWTSPRVLPPAWVEVERQIDGSKYLNHRAHLAAIVSCQRETDGQFWIHLSVSHRDRVPNWQELIETKQVFLGDREAYMVHPPKARYVNLHPHVLHLFARLQGEAVLPDFTQGTRSL